MKQVALIACILILTVDGYAQVLPFHTNSALTIGFEEKAIRSFFFRAKFSGLRQNGRSIADPLDREMTVTAAPVAVPYAVHRTLVPIAIVPFVSKNLSIDSPAGRRSIDNRGVGDVTALLKYAALQWDRLNETRRLAFFGGVKFPTASTQAKDDEGQLLPAPLQLGTGAYEVPLGVAFTMQTPYRIGILSDFFYNINTDGQASTGTDSFRYDVAVSWRGYPSDYRTFEENVLNFYLELNGHHELDSGDALFLSPGVQFIPLRNVLFELSFQKPIYQNFRDVRPGSDYTVGAGFRWLLPF